MSQTHQLSTPHTIILPAGLTREWVETCEFAKAPPHTGVLDFTATETIDSAGISFVNYLTRISEGRITRQNVSPQIAAQLAEWTPAPPVTAQKNPVGFFATIGFTAIKYRDVVLSALSMLVEMIYWGTLGLAKRRTIKKGAFFEQLYQLGYGAAGIVMLLSFLIGVVLALQAAISLQTYGAGVFLAPMIGISMIRELGPMLTAIICAGRTGSATTAEIATMKVNEEIDALTTMGIHPIQFVVVPKFWAMSIALPLLSICATFVGIFGGYLIAVFYLGIAPDLFISGLTSKLSLRDVQINVVKSLIFSWLIIWIGAYFGFKVRGGAEAVGKATTTSVVTGIFIVILADALFSFVFYR